MNSVEHQYEKISSHPIFNKVIEDLALNIFRRKIKLAIELVISHEDIRKSIWLASILVNSNNDEDKKKVQLFSSLLSLSYPESKEIAQVCYVLFSRIGNLTATKFLTPLFVNFSDDPSKQVSTFEMDSTLSFELIKKRAEQLLILENQSYLTTTFQKNLWDSLLGTQNVSISAPTSSGKSFIIKKFIEQQFLQNEKYCAIYIVPSRALINQVSEEFHQELKHDIVIKTAYIENELINDKEIYILTPERCLRLLYDGGEIINPRLIFIDEIQGVEDEQGRGILFEYVFEELEKSFPNAKIICAGPNIINPEELFVELFSQPNAPIHSLLSPVFQIKTIVKGLDNNNLEFNIKVQDNRSITITKNTNFNFKNKINSNIGKGLADLLNFIAPNDWNLVYATNGYLADSWASRYAETIQIDEYLNYEISELIEYLVDEIHPKYYLINCLKKKIAFHHSKLPELVRKEIESLFQEGIIKTLFCTSTLLEGVNLPANNLFIVKPEKSSIELSEFEFGNLIGRAGRIKDSLYGTIYCILKDGDNDWAEKYYSSTYEKEVKTSSSKSLPFITTEKLSMNVLDLDDNRDVQSVISLRHKFLSNQLSLDSYLTKKNVSDEKKILIINELNETLDHVTLSSDVLKLNPSIDPILQNTLFLKITEQGIENWLLDKSTIWTGQKKEVAEVLDYKQKNFYWQLVSIMTRMNEIFEIRNEIWHKDNISISPAAMCYHGNNWLKGIGLGEMIKEDIRYYSEDPRVPKDKKIDPNNIASINIRIRDVININSKVVTFRLVKYLKLLGDILESMLTEEEKEKHSFTLSLHTYFELGTMEPYVIQLVSGGVSRSIALKVFEQFKKTREYKEEMSIFTWLSSLNEVKDLKPIYNRYLKRIKLLKE